MNCRITTTGLRQDKDGVFWCIMFGFKNGLGFLQTTVRIPTRP